MYYVDFFNIHKYLFNLFFFLTEKDWAYYFNGCISNITLKMYYQNFLFREHLIYEINFKTLTKIQTYRDYLNAFIAALRRKFSLKKNTLKIFITDELFSEVLFYFINSISIIFDILTIIVLIVFCNLHVETEKILFIRTSTNLKRF